MSERKCPLLLACFLPEPNTTSSMSIHDSDPEKDVFCIFSQKLTHNVFHWGVVWQGTGIPRSYSMALNKLQICGFPSKDLKEYF